MRIYILLGALDVDRTERFYIATFDVDKHGGGCGVSRGSFLIVSSGRRGLAISGCAGGWVRRCSYCIGLAMLDGDRWGREASGEGDDEREKEAGAQPRKRWPARRRRGRGPQLYAVRRWSAGGQPGGAACSRLGRLRVGKESSAAASRKRKYMRAILITRRMKANLNK